MRRAAQEIIEVVSSEGKAIRAYIWMEMTVALQVDEKYRKDETRRDKYNVIISALWGKSSS